MFVFDCVCAPCACVPPRYVVGASTLAADLKGVMAEAMELFHAVVLEELVGRWACLLGARGLCQCAMCKVVCVPVCVCLCVCVEMDLGTLECVIDHTMCDTPPARLAWVPCALPSS